MLDRTDIALIRALQRDSTLTTQALSEELNLSASQIGRRKQRLEAEGYIRGYMAKLDPKRLGLTVQTFIQVETAAHSPDAHKAFLRLVEIRPEIVAAWTMTGEADYILRVYCTDLAELNQLVQDVLLPHPSVSRIHSQIVMEQIKRDAPLPT